MNVNITDEGKRYNEPITMMLTFGLSDGDLLGSLVTLIGFKVFPVGDCVSSVGATVGLVDRDCVGSIVGSAVGTSVGASDGLVDGICVGSIVGSAVGTAVGGTVGLVDGNCVGSFVGSVVGANVKADGASFGLNVATVGAVVGGLVATVGFTVGLLIGDARVLMVPWLDYSWVVLFDLNILMIVGC